MTLNITITIVFSNYKIRNKTYFASDFFFLLATAKIAPDTTKTAPTKPSKLITVVWMIVTSSNAIIVRVEIVIIGFRVMIMLTFVASKYLKDSASAP